jgi:hypothetical protein
MIKASEKFLLYFITSVFIIEIFIIVWGLIDHYFIHKANALIFKHIGNFFALFLLIFIANIIFLGVYKGILKNASALFYKRSLLLSLGGIFILILFAFFTMSQLH